MFQRISLFSDSGMLRSCICEYMRSLALSNCVDSRTSQLTFPRWPACFARCVKTGKHVIMKTAHKRHKYVRFVCMFTLQIRFLLSPFAIVWVAVWITVFARFDRCLNYFNLLQNTGANLFCIWNFLSAVIFLLLSVTKVKGPLIFLFFPVPI